MKFKPFVALWCSLVSIVMMWVQAGVVIAGCLAVVCRVDGANSDEPLFITPYLESGEIDKARSLARNSPFEDNVDSYSGFLTVNATAGMHTFFWFFPAESSTGTEPLMVWLQGGPGASSMFGALIEHGPYRLTPSGEILKREFRWNKNINMLYIDNPAGVGYSFTDPGTVPTSQEKIGHYLYTAVQQFLLLFPDLRKRPFYASGESYGGKYVPALAHTIHVKNVHAIDKINLVGIVIGNGLIDPVNMVSAYPKHQYQLSLIDDIERRDMENRCKKLVQDIKAGRWYDASERFREMFWNNKTQPDNLLTNNTGFTFHYNILVSHDDGTSKAVSQFMNLPNVKKALHVGKLPFQDGSLAEDALHDDMMKSVLPWFVVLAENYNVLLYSGQLDIIIPHPTTDSFLKKMKWSGAADFLSTPKKIWRVGREIAGYSKTVRRRKNGADLLFVDLVVRSAGHIVPHDKPGMAFDMISRFVSKAKPF